PLNAADIELNNIDYILYFELLDTIVHADIGAGLTNLDGTVRNLNAGALTQYDLDEYSPLLYATAGVKLPFTGMSAKAEAVYSHGSDIKKTDVQAELQYDFIDNLLVDVGAKVGYRIMNIDAEQNNAPDLELEFKGPYIGLDIHF
ncbi:TIGR04219 family outer membrane beta-barrel protein, partial [Acinetobacter variabilis]|uniref:TIGR04219 family outer membrane beta-barrel protein n=1 Tax=Acinetobacter variabilis TaxID=70346 RepID=UPI003D7684ED